MNHTNKQNISEIHIIGNHTKERLAKFPEDSGGFRITLAGLSDARKGFHFRHKTPQLAQILACYEGEGMVSLNGKFKPCRAGQAYITPSGKFHEYYASTDRIWRLAWVHIASTDDSYTPKEPALIDMDAEAFAEIISGSYKEYISVRDPAIMMNWYAILQEQCRRILGKGEIDLRLRRLWQTVDASLDQAWTLEAMAELANMSEEHLRRLCITEYGCSPIRHLTGLRMQRAATLLKSSTMKITQIALRVGYENPLAFSTAFRKFMKCCPSALRNKGSGLQ